MENRFEARRNILCAKVNEREIRMVEIECNIDRKEENTLQAENFMSYTGRIHCGWVLNGGYQILYRVSYDVIAETNAGNYLARRSLEDLRSTRGQYHGHTVLLQAARGAVPSDGTG